MTKRKRHYLSPDKQSEEDKYQSLAKEFPGTILSPDRVRLIRKWYDTGKYTPIVIADMLDIKPKTISKIIKRKTYDWVED